MTEEFADMDLGDKSFRDGLFYSRTQEQETCPPAKGLSQHISHTPQFNAKAESWMRFVLSNGAPDKTWLADFFSCGTFFYDNEEMKAFVVIYKTPAMLRVMPLRSTPELESLASDHDVFVIAGIL